MHEGVRDGLPHGLLRVVGHVFAKRSFKKRTGSHVLRNGGNRFRDHDGNRPYEIVRVEEPLAGFLQCCFGCAWICGERHRKARKVLLRIESEGEQPGKCRSQNPVFVLVQYAQGFQDVLFPKFLENARMQESLAFHERVDQRLVEVVLGCPFDDARIMTRLRVLLDQAVDFVMA